MLRRGIYKDKTWQQRTRSCDGDFLSRVLSWHETRKGLILFARIAGEEKLEPHYVLETRNVKGTLGVCKEKEEKSRVFF